jgi:hypothetical protein
MSGSECIAALCGLTDQRDKACRSEIDVGQRCEERKLNEIMEDLGVGGRESRRSSVLRDAYDLMDQDILQISRLMVFAAGAAIASASQHSWETLRLFALIA